VSFYITGLPRSRTAWLARVFTHGKVRCLHDPIGRFGEKWQETAKALEAGVSDCGLSLICPELERGRWLIVRRDFYDAADSFLRMPRYPFETGPRDLDVLRKMEAGLKEIERTQEHRTVSFDSLDDEHQMRGVWEFLVGDVEPWCPWHWDEMRHLRVTVKPETYSWR